MHANSKGRWFLLLCWLGAALAVRRGPELGPYGIELNITADDDVPLTVHTPLDPFISNDGQYFFNASNYREPYMTKEHVERFITNLMFPTVMSVVSRSQLIKESLPRARSSSTMGLVGFLADFARHSTAAVIGSPPMQPCRI